MQEPSFYVVSLLLVVSNVYWMCHVQILVNKIMSRDFTEFRSAEVKAPKQDKRPELVNQLPSEDLRILQDLGI